MDDGIRDKLQWKLKEFWLEYSDGSGKTKSQNNGNGAQISLYWMDRSQNTKPFI